MKKILTVAVAVTALQFGAYASAMADDDSGIVTTVGPGTWPEEDGGVIMSFWRGLLGGFWR